MDNQQGNIQIEKIAYTIGLFLGDGTLRCAPIKERKASTVYSVRIRMYDHEPIMRAQMQINNFFGTDYTVKTEPGTGDEFFFRAAGYRKVIYDFFASMTSYRQGIPYEIFAGSIRTKKEFIAGIIDSDGFVSVDRSGRLPRYSMGFANTNKGIVINTGRLLQSLGVKLRKLDIQSTSVKNPYYNLRWNVRSFIDAGCYLYNGRKLERLANYILQVCPSTTKLVMPKILG